MEIKIQISQQQFEAHLNDLKEKAEYLSDSLDAERRERSGAEQEVNVPPSPPKDSHSHSVTHLHYHTCTRSQHLHCSDIQTLTLSHPHILTQILEQQSKIEDITVEFQTVVKQNEEKVHTLNQRIDELCREKALNEKDVEMTK